MCSSYPGFWGKLLSKSAVLYRRVVLNLRNWLLNLAGRSAVTIQDVSRRCSWYIATLFEAELKCVSSSVQFRLILLVVCPVSLNALGVHVLHSIYRRCRYSSNGYTSKMSRRWGDEKVSSTWWRPCWGKGWEAVVWSGQNSHRQGPIHCESPHQLIAGVNLFLPAAEHPALPMFACLIHFSLRANPELPIFLSLLRRPCALENCTPELPLYFLAAGSSILAPNESIFYNHCRWL